MKLGAPFFFLALICYFPLSGQGISEVIRFSYLEPGGTARFIGVGGAMGAIGPDLGTLNGNPAGLGLYRKSEFVVSPALIRTGNTALLLSDKNGTAVKASKLGLNIQNFGMVFTSQPAHGKWKQMNFGMTVNNLNYFGNNTRFNGTSVGTIMQRFQEIANSSVGLDDFETGLASESGALYDLNGDRKYDIDYQLSPKALLQRSQDITNTGSISELAFSLGGNYNEKIMVGLTIGLPFLSYYHLRDYAEVDPVKPPGGVPYFLDLRYREELSTTGAGANAKLGVLILPVSRFRIGFAVHSPTFFNISDLYQNELTYNYFENANETGKLLKGEGIADGSFEYRLKTPWRYVANAGLILGKLGFLCAEAELVDYSRNRFNFRGFGEAQNQSNLEIAGRLGRAVALRMGGEAVLKEDYRLRAGLQYYSSPFKDDETARLLFSLGAGWRGKKAFVDAAIRFNRTSEVFFPYLTRNAPLQEVDNAILRQIAVLTVGSKF